MTLIPEDGTGTDPLANSYADLTYIKTFWTARGYALPSDAALETYAFGAMDYIEAKRAQYQGRKTWRGQTVDSVVYPVQPLQFPREDMQIDCIDIASDVIPKELMDAEAAGAYEASKADLMPTTEGGLPVIRKKLGPMEKQWSDAIAVAQGGMIDGPTFPKLDSLLDALIYGCGGAYIRTKRV